MRFRTGFLLMGAIASLFVISVTHPSLAQDLVVDNMTVTLGGTQRFTNVRVVNNGRINVPAFDGTDRANTGNLVIVAESITIDATSRIDATGAGYQPVLCGN